MKILDLLKNVSIDVNATCSNKDEAIDTLVSLMAKQGNLNDQDVYKQGIYAREELSTTGICRCSFPPVLGTAIIKKSFAG